MSFIIFIVYYYFKNDKYANDYVAYFNWFKYVSSFESIAQAIDYREDIVLSIYFYLISILGDTKLVFDLSVVILIMACLLWSTSRILTCSERTTFFVLLISSRLFLEYSGNTMRSFISAILLVGFIYLGIGFIKSKSVVVRTVIAFFTHFKLASFIIVFRPVFSIIDIKNLKNSRQIINIIFVFSCAVFISKYFLSLKFDNIIGYFASILDMVQGDTDIKFRVERLDASFNLTASLFTQILIYVFYPLAVVFIKNESIETAFSSFLATSALLFAFLFPEYFLMERLCQVLFIISLIEFSKLKLKLYYYLPLIFLNFYSIYSIDFSW